ncbi:MAG TPA: SpoIIE family protein phosphatase [Spirochaetota bacterium]|nr:SpoIIE family protein phosphatase [Spirochaetota bacterium]HPJ34600.1 SpoIIE family protein phosphatase [Spirochaetota bacterium]
MSKKKRDQIIPILKTIPTLSGLSNEELELIAPLFSEKTFHSGDFIIVEGTQGNTMYIINKGAVLVTKSDRKGEPISLGVLNDGAFFGELSLFDSLPRSATVTAIEDTSIFMLTRDELDSLFASNLEITNKIYYNTLIEIFSRFRKNVSNFTFSQYYLREKNEILNKINRDLSSAQEIQEYFVDTELNDSSCMEIRHSYIYQPSEAIGGDLISMKAKDGRIYMMIADVQGHGITAALVTGVLKSAFVMLVDECGDQPDVFLTKLNNHLYEVINSIYATCYYAIIDTYLKKVTFAKAGHHHPFFWKSGSESFDEITSKGPGLGMVDDPVYSVTELPYNSGDKLLFFTDGIIEQRNRDGKMYSLEKLNGSFKNAILKGEEKILNSLLLNLHNYAANVEYEDDITMLLFEF